MKIQFDNAGAVPIQPDFAMLCAGLVGVQAASPTALAEAAPPLLKERVNRVVDSLAWPLDGVCDSDGSASFHPATALRNAGEE